MSSSLDDTPASSGRGIASGRRQELPPCPTSTQITSPSDSPLNSAQSRVDPQSASQAITLRSSRSCVSQTSPPGPLDYRFKPSRLKPTVSPSHGHSHSVPPALPFRPSPNISPTFAVPPHTEHVKKLTSPSLPSTLPAGSSRTGKPPELTLVSAVSANVATARYPMVNMSPPVSPTSRTRSGSVASVASERPSHKAESTLRPADMFRRASLSAHAGTTSMPRRASIAAPGSSTPLFLANYSIQADNGPHSRGTGHFLDQQHSSPTRYEDLALIQERIQRPRLNSGTLKRSGCSIPPTSSPGQQSCPPSRRPSPSRSSSHTQPLVKKKDSPALRPLAASPFLLHSPPQSPTSRARSRSGTVSSIGSPPSIPTTRGRAASIMAVVEPLKEASEGSICDSDEVSITERRRSARLPSL